MVAPTVCGTWWSEILTSFKSNYDDLIEGHPDCNDEILLIRTALFTTGQLTQNSPAVNGNGAGWIEFIARAEAERTMLY
jgi:hypothetical protein